MSETIATDVLVVGAGIAGAGVGAELAGVLDVVLVEQESRPGHHSTGRSAALFFQNYGNAAIRALSRASRPLFEAADPGLFPNPLLSPRGALEVADEGSRAALEALLVGSEGMRAITSDQACAMVPALRRECVHAAAYEADAQDIDVAALHQGFLRKARAGGARLLTEAPLVGARPRSGGGWTVETKAATIEAEVIVNAAGAWADRVAQYCGVAPLGIQPMRRTIAVLPAPIGHDVSRWPLFGDAGEGWYAKPDAGRLLVSPGDEDPVEPQDAFVDDMVLAEGLHRFEQAVDFPITRVERRWAGLRSFAPDRTPVAGFDRTAPNFFWLAGQGGYGIQTAPALSKLAACLIERVSVPSEVEAIVNDLSPDRFRNP